MRHQIKKVKFHDKFSKCGDPDPEEIQTLWRELVALGDLASEGRRAGLARARTRLLNSIPPHKLPAFLDSLEAAI